MVRTYVLGLPRASRRRAAANVGADALERRLGDDRAGVVQDQALHRRARLRRERHADQARRARCRASSPTPTSSRAISVTMSATYCGTDVELGSARRSESPRPATSGQTTRKCAAKRARQVVEIARGARAVRARRPARRGCAGRPTPGRRCGAGPWARRTAPSAAAALGSMPASAIVSTSIARARGASARLRVERR